MVTFGRLSVSAESENVTLGFLSVSAESDLDFRCQTESLFLSDNTAFVTQSVSWSVCSCKQFVTQTDFKE